MVVSYLPPSLSLLAIILIIVVYLIICYIVIDLIGYYGVSSQHNHPKECNSVGLSVEELQAMACYYNNNLGRANSSSTCCVVCLKKLKNGELCRVFPDCNHVFHSECIDPWLEMRVTCPVCRTPFCLKKHLKSCHGT
ncbi:hypothetical protein Leryth_022210 [Lithospermum erythrorhizon]|nr:hypothetical protein Leryth_022210 [Lithospermum erythrorhizon]